MFNKQMICMINEVTCTFTERVPVEMVCYWWWPGYFITKDVMNFTMATVQNYSVTFQYSVQEINQTLTVECVYVKRTDFLISSHDGHFV